MKTKTTINEHPRIGKFVAAGCVFQFQHLPPVCQDALIHYMSVDGAAWAVEDEWEDWSWGEGAPGDLYNRRQVMRDIKRFRPRFVAQYGKTMFGMVTVPYLAMMEAVDGDDVFVAGRVGYPDCKTTALFEKGMTCGRNCSLSHYNPFEAVYRDHGYKISPREYDEPTWPVIFSDFTDESLQDGWHRLHQYCKRRMPVPAVWFAD